MAIEDAAVLSRLLSHVRGPKELEGTFSGLMTRYGGRGHRGWSGRVVMRGSFMSFRKDEVGDNVEGLRRDIEGRMRWIWDVDLDGMIAEAVGDDGDMGREVEEGGWKW